jgi:hypothetical protein
MAIVFLEMMNLQTVDPATGHGQGWLAQLILAVIAEEKAIALSDMILIGFVRSLVTTTDTNQRVIWQHCQKTLHRLRGNSRV